MSLTSTEELPRARQNRGVIPANAGIHLRPTGMALTPGFPEAASDGSACRGRQGLPGGRKRRNAAYGPPHKRQEPHTVDAYVISGRGTLASKDSR